MSPSFPHFSCSSVQQMSTTVCLVKIRIMKAARLPLPVPIATRLLRLWVRIPREACLSVVSVMCCQAEVSATGCSLIQRSPTECAVSVCV